MCGHKQTVASEHAGAIPSRSPLEEQPMVFVSVRFQVRVESAMLRLQLTVVVPCAATRGLTRPR